MDGFTRKREMIQTVACFLYLNFQLLTINEQIQNIAQKKDTLCRRMYN